MDIEFWHSRWEQNRIGFHQKGIHESLEKYWPTLDLPADAKVFVPLCGKSNDIFYILDQGQRVLGNEVSPIAVRDLFAENDLEPLVSHEGDFDCYRVDELEVYCGDFFQLKPEHLQGVECVYDRASLAALPPDMRKRYAEQMKALLGEGVRVLLVSFTYDQSRMSGPPFSVPESEIRSLYEGSFAIKKLESRDAFPANPGFKERGLDAIEENIYELLRLER